MFYIFLGVFKKCKECVYLYWKNCFLLNVVWIIGIYKKIEKKILSGIVLNYYFLENMLDNIIKNIY